MFQLEIETEFAAAHAIVIGGRREPLHGHNWHVTAVVAGESLDDDGLLIDFHEVERHLRKIIEPFRNANLNECPPFLELNPTAEHIAMHIGRALSGRLSGAVGVARVRVTEAPGCAAVWQPV